MVKRMAENNGWSYVDLDDPDALYWFNKDIKMFSRNYLGDVSVIDEIQYGEDAGRKLKYLSDVEGKRIIATGSSARGVSREVLSFLVGRSAVHFLFPFSLSEIIDPAMNPLEKRRISEQYLRAGGFPEVFIGLRKPEEIVYSLIYKEVPRLEGVEAAELWKFAETLALTTGPLNLSSIASSLSISLFRAKKMLMALQEALVLVPVRPFFGEKRSREIRRAPKVYYVDPGILSVLRGSDVIDGHLLETAVFSELLKLGYRPYYWRTKDGSEVDFVLITREGIVGIEVKLSGKGRIPRRFQVYDPVLEVVVSLDGRNDSTALWELPDVLSDYPPDPLRNPPPFF